MRRHIRCQLYPGLGTFSPDLHLRLDDTRIIQRSRLQSYHLWLIRVLMINAITTNRTKITPGNIAAGSWPVKDPKFATQQFEVFTFNQHGHTKGTGRELLTVNAVADNGKQWRLFDYVMYLAALAGTCGWISHM